MTAHHRKAPLYGVPEHPAGAFAAHSHNLDALIKHDLALLSHNKDGVTEQIYKHHHVIFKRR